MSEFHSRCAPRALAEALPRGKETVFCTDFLLPHNGSPEIQWRTATARLRCLSVHGSASRGVVLRAPAERNHPAGQAATARRLEEGALVSKLIETVDRIHLLDGRCVTEGSGFFPAVGCPPASRHTPLSVGSSQLVRSLRPSQREMTSPVTKPHGNDFPSPSPYSVGQKQVAVLHVQQEGLLKSEGHRVSLPHS